MLSFKQFLEEKWGQDTAKAIGLHYRMEKKLGNPLMKPGAIAAAAGMIGMGLSTAIANKSLAGGALVAGSWAPSFAPHIKDIVKIRNKIKERKARDQDNVSDR